MGRVTLSITSSRQNALTSDLVLHNKYLPRSQVQFILLAVSHNLLSPHPPSTTTQATTFAQTTVPNNFMNYTANKRCYLYKCSKQLEFFVYLIVCNRKAIGLHAVLNSLLHTNTTKTLHSNSALSITDISFNGRILDARKKILYYS